METRKKRILFHSDSSLAKTGFGRNTKEILTYLFNTGKYEIFEYCCSKNWTQDQEHLQKPWRSFGTLPDNKQEIKGADEQAVRLASYGANNLDKIVEIAKPDVYFAVQDIWGIQFALDKHWFDKTTSVFWTTLDSLPIVRDAIAVAPKVKNYWVWSKFAEDALKRLDHGHVKTMHGAVNPKQFFRLKDRQRKELRDSHNISYDDFIIGFVFRNQPRKSLPQLLDAFQLLKKDAPEVKNPKLLLHTSWREGWDISELAEQRGISLNDIYTTYICASCHDYRVQNYVGEKTQCPHCNSPNSFSSTHPRAGVSEGQLNEIYNLMDVYCHPFTSGGQEIPVQEAKFSELITLVTNYSCGEEMCQPEAQSLPLSWDQYFEPGSNFIKASTKPFSIVKQLKKVYNMPEKQKREMGKKARAWAIDNYSSEVIAKKIEQFIDGAPFCEIDFTEEKTKPNPLYEMEKIDKSNEDWVLELFHNVYGDKNFSKHSPLVKNLSKALNNKKTNKASIENHYRKEAASELYNQKKDKFFKELKKDENLKLCFVMPQNERDVLLSTALFKNIKKKYCMYKLYVATKPEFFNIVLGHPDVDKVIEFYPEMNNPLFLEGVGDHPGFFDVALLPYLMTQTSPSYIHNGQDDHPIEIFSGTPESLVKEWRGL